MIHDTNHHEKTFQEEREGMAEWVQGDVVLIFRPSIPPVPTKWEARAVRRGQRHHMSPTILVDSNIIVTNMIPRSRPITNITTQVMMVYLLCTLVFTACVLILPIAAGKIVAMLLNEA